MEASQISAQLVERRNKYLAQLPAGSVVVISAYAPKQQLDYRLLRASADFCYLTDLWEVCEQGWLILAPGQVPCLLLEQVDETKRMWEGQSMDFAEAAKRSGIDLIKPFSMRFEVLDGLLKDAKTLIFDEGQDFQLAQALQEVAKKNTLEVAPLAQSLHQNRLIKDACEIERIQNSVAWSITAHASIMAGLEPGLSEQFIAAEFTYALAMVEGFHQAYPAIVAGGNHACTLHHSPTAYTLQAHDWLLIDAGAVYQGYCADLTRTMPVSGKAQAPWRDVYSVVLQAQAAAISALRPGQTWGAVERAAQNVLAQGLLDLGIVKGGSAEAVIADGRLRQLYPHRIGHSLGLDVHDMAPLKDDTLLQPGMVVTIEPGLYMAEGQQAVSDKWRGFGVRIEDNILLTEDEPVNLSAELPSDLAEIELLLGSI